jgi:catechol 2,3-dioxygenase-like lactoylglutathione lyase family enzyme
MFRAGKSHHRVGIDDCDGTSRRTRQRIVMLSYIILGANDIPRSERFYTAVLEPLGYEKAEQKDTVIYTLPDIPDRFNGPGAVYVTKPYDGREATVGNGSMIAFRVPTHAQVHALHSAGVAAGGTDEGAPGFRAQYSKNFFVGYLRDPLGNKLALFCTATELEI